MESRGILISTSDACAIGCRFCFRADVGRDVLTLPTYARALSRLRELGFDELCLTGGEPTDHADFHRLVQVALQFGYRPSTVTAAREGLRLDALARAAGMLEHVTVSADSRHTDGVERTGRSIRSTIPVFAALGHDRASLHVTCNDLDEQDLDDIAHVAESAGVRVEVSPLLPSPRHHRFHNDALRRDVATIRNIFGLSPELEILTDEYFEMLTSGERPLCRSERLYMSADGYLRRCPYEQRRQISVHSERRTLADGIERMFTDPPRAGLSCLAICRVTEDAQSEHEEAMA